MQILLTIFLIFAQSAYSQEEISPSKEMPKEERVQTPVLTNEEALPPKKVEVVLEPQNSQVEKEIKPETTIMNLFYISVGFGYNSITSMESSRITVKSGSNTGYISAVWDWESATTLNLEIGTNKSGIGWALGFDYDSKRSSGMLTMSGAGGTASAGTQGATINIINTKVDLLYTINNAYIRIGSNYSYPDINIPDVAYNIKGDLGFQGGFGYYFDNHIGIDVYYRKSNFVGTVESSGATLDLGTLSASGLIFLIRYKF